MSWVYFLWKKQQQESESKQLSVKVMKKDEESKLFLLSLHGSALVSSRSTSTLTSKNLPLINYALVLAQPIQNFFRPIPIVI